MYLSIHLLFLNHLRVNSDVMALCPKYYQYFLRPKTFSFKLQYNDQNQKINTDKILVWFSLKVRSQTSSISITWALLASTQPYWVRDAGGGLWPSVFWQAPWVQSTLKFEKHPSNPQFVVKVSTFVPIMSLERTFLLDCFFLLQNPTRDHLR